MAWVSSRSRRSISSIRMTSRFFASSSISSIRFRSSSNPTFDIDSPNPFTVSPGETWITPPTVTDARERTLPYFFSSSPAFSFMLGRDLPMASARVAKKPRSSRSSF
ncbi:hypothetical protein D3C75_678500 [compost metagenome]